MRTILILALSAAFIASPACAAQDIAPSVEAALDRARTDIGAPGMTAAVWSGGVFVADVASGVRSAGTDSAVAPSDAFHIGSVTKSMTAVVAGRLVDQGRMRWDETVGERLGAVIPGIPPSQSGVTLEMLLAHEGGAPERLSPSQLQAVTQAPNMTGRRLAVAHAVLTATPAGPQGAMRYSNPGYVIAAAMIEQAAGRSWEDLITEVVFAPLKLTSAGFGPPQGSAAVRGHRREDGGLIALDPASPASDNPAFLRPAGGVHMTMRDLALYGVDQLKGIKGQSGVLLSADGYRRIHSERSAHQGLGWAHGPEGDFDNSGSNGRWFALIRVFPDSDLVIAVAANAFNDQTEQRVIALTDEIRRRLSTP